MELRCHTHSIIILSTCFLHVGWYVLIRVYNVGCTYVGLWLLAFWVPFAVYSVDFDADGFKVAPARKTKEQQKAARQARGEDDMDAAGTNNTARPDGVKRGAALGKGESSAKIGKGFVLCKGPRCTDIVLFGGAKPVVPKADLAGQLG